MQIFGIAPPQHWSRSAKHPFVFAVRERDWIVLMGGWGLIPRSKVNGQRQASLDGARVFEGCLPEGSLGLALMAPATAQHDGENRHCTPSVGSMRGTSRRAHSSAILGLNLSASSSLIIADLAVSPAVTFNLLQCYRS